MTNPKADRTAMEQLQAKAAARAKLVNEVAGLLWEHGEGCADTEGGLMPTWDEVVYQRMNPRQIRSADHYDACCVWWLEYTHKAEALLDLDATASLRIGEILIGLAGEKFKVLEMDLWRKIERAKGFEPGSLTGKPGVKQRVAL